MIPLRTANSPHEVLSLMEELYKDEKRWTKGSFARNEYGDTVGWDDECAESWCLTGAVRQLGESFVVASDTYNALFSTIAGFENVAQFNDSPSTTIEDIRRVIKEAKEKC